MSITKIAGRCFNGITARTAAVVGSQWGDEGKGKLVDILASQYDVCARFNGGANAGHTIVVNKQKYALHLLPCGILYDSCVNILGNGVVVHLQTMFDELKQLDRDNISYKGRLLLSDRAHITTQALIEADSAHEAKTGSALGTTKRGIGPTYSAKASRFGLRVGDLKYWDEFVQKYNILNDRVQADGHQQVNRDGELKEFKQLRERLYDNNMIIDSIEYLNRAYKENKRILFEGANAIMLDLDYGTYPYVTSSSTGVGGIATGTGFNQNNLETTIGIVKAYTTRVGSGPFPTELDNEVGTEIRRIGHEYGATTGRPRRCGWLDLVVVKYSHLLNQYTSINLTKLDVLSHLDQIKVAVSYRLDGQVLNSFPSNLTDLARVDIEYVTFKGWQSDISKVKQYQDLPKEAQEYIEGIEQLSGIPVSWIGVGPERESMVRKDLKQ